MCPTRDSTVLAEFEGVAKGIEHAATGDFIWTINGVPTGAEMASAAEGFGNAGNIDPPLAAQAYAITRAGDLAKEGRSFHSLNAKRPVDQTFAILLGGATGAHVNFRDVHPGNGALAPEIRESPAQ